MTTTGEYLLSRSSLPSGTALAHLLSITGGADRVLFCSQRTAFLESNETTVLHQAIGTALGTTESDQATTRSDNQLFAFANAVQAYSFNQPHSIFVTQRVKRR